MPYWPYLQAQPNGRLRPLPRKSTSIQDPSPSCETLLPFSLYRWGAWAAHFLTFGESSTSLYFPACPFEQLWSQRAFAMTEQLSDAPLWSSWGLRNDFAIPTPDLALVLLALLLICPFALKSFSTICHPETQQVLALHSFSDLTFVIYLAF